MKSIFTLVMSSLMAASVFAADVTGRITVSFSGNKDYKVLIDGKTYDAGYNNRVYVKDIRPGRHTIAVYNIRTKNYKRSNRPVYTGTFLVRPNRDMDIRVDRNGRVAFDESYNTSRRYEKDDRNRDWEREREWNRDRDDDRNKGDWNNDYNQAMRDDDFRQWMQRIDNQWLGKLNAAKEGVNRNYFTTYQVRQLLQLFSSEKDKLELAKLAYSKTVDPGNYSQLYDLFNSRSSREELDQFIRKNRW